jgi:hypothetical protein
MLDLSRRGFLAGLSASLLAATSLVKIKAKSVIYCNRTIRVRCDVRAIRDRNALLRMEDWAREPVVHLIDRIRDIECTSEDAEAGR